MARVRANSVASLLKFDLDGNGRVTLAEVTTYHTQEAARPLRANRILVEPTREQGAQILKSLVAQTMQADADKDGEINLDEMLASFAKGPKPFEARPLRELRMILKLDRDGDGVTSAGEFDAAVEKLVHSVDEDGNGRVSFEEYEANRADMAKAEPAYRRWVEEINAPQR